MKISRPVLVNVSLAVVIALVIAGGIIFLLPKSTATATEATQLTTTVQEGAVSSTITASGSIAARSEVTADFAVSGTVKELSVELGETVTKGQKLGKLARGDFDDALADAQEQLADAQAQVTDAYTAISEAESSSSSSSNGQSSSSTNSEQAVSSAEDQLASAQDQVETAQDAVDTAQDNIDSTVLHAPIAGLIIAVTGAEGSTSGSSSGGSSSAASGATTGDNSTTTSASGFVTIADVAKMTMTAAIAEADIANVKVGQSVDVTFPALTDVTATATVTEVAPTATSSNSVVTYATTITLDEIPDGLRLGQTAEATITTVSSADDALQM